MTIPLEWTRDEPPAIHGLIWERRTPSCLEHKQALMDEIAQDLAARGYISEEDHHWLYLCLDEALVNAILHGNEADDTVDVVIRLGLIGDRWWLRIDDQGTGFIPEDDVPNTEDTDCLLLEHGRGIRLMREWLDQLQYFRGGSVLIMARRVVVG